MNTPRSKEETIESTTAIPVSAYRIEKKDIVPSISAPGTIDFKDKVDVYSKLSGRIEKIYVKEGDQVKIGQKLFKIESLQYELELMKQEATLESSHSQVQLAKEKLEKAKTAVESRLKEQEKSKSLINRAKEEYEKAKKTFERKEAIFKEGGISTEEIELSKLDLTRSESNYNLAKKDLEIHSAGLTDEDIIKNGFKVPKTEKEKVEIIKEINTKIEKAELAVAEGAYRASEAQSNATKILLKEIVNYSPISGVVAKKYKSEGEMINGNASGNQSVLTIINVSQVNAVFNISESDAVHLKKDMKVDFSADAFKNENFTGKVIFKSPLIDQKVHTNEVKALVNNKDGRLMPGMFIRINLITGKPVPTILVPLTAIIPKEDDLASVFKVVDGLCKKVEIRTGRKFGEYIEVKEGLEGNEIIVLDKLSQIRDGISVKPNFLPN